MNLKQIFRMYCSTDEILHAMLNPFEIEGIVCATDACQMIFTEKENIDFEVVNPAGIKLPSANNIIPPIVCRELLDLSKIDFEALKTEPEYRVIKEEKTCAGCDGGGEVEWEYSCGLNTYYKDFECPVCEGSGISEPEYKELTGNKCFGEKYITINAVTFHISFIHNLKLVSDFVNEKVYLLSSPTEQRKGYLFEIGKLKVLVMPIIGAEQEDVLLAINTLTEPISD